MNDVLTALKGHLDVAVLILIVLVIGGANLFWTSHVVTVNQDAQARQQAVQRREGQLVEEKICADVGTMAAIRPPGGLASANPSRAYEQAEHRAWAGLVADLGCPPAARRN